MPAGRAAKRAATRRAVMSTAAASRPALGNAYIKPGGHSQQYGPR